MNNIINFPTKSVKDKALIKKSIQTLLDQTPADQKVKDELTARLLGIFEQYRHEYSMDFRLEFPPGITQAQADKIGSSIKENIGKFERLIHDHMNTILMERFQTEIKIYFLENKM